MTRVSSQETAQGALPVGTADELDEVVRLMQQADSIVLLCHVNPDGDALGSTLALHHLARAHGLNSVASWPEPFVVASHYAFLPGLDLATKPADLPAEPDLVITFDCGSLDRLVELAPLAARAKCRDRLVVLDHHITNDRFGSLNAIDPAAAATAVVVRELIRRLDWRLDRDAAMCLYTGLVTDTGRFQYSNTTPEVFALAQELSEYDLPIAEMTRQLFEEHRFAYLQLAGACISRAELDIDLHLVATWIDQADFEQFDVTFEECEGLIDLVRRASEAEVACVLKDTPEGVKVSLRSVSDIDVGALACQFGGGGHRFAAGFTHIGPVQVTLGAIRSALAAGLG